MTENSISTTNVASGSDQPLVSRCYSSVAEMMDDIEGRFCDKKRPKCGAHLLHNKKKDEWCSYVKCDFGIEEPANVEVSGIRSTS